MIEPHFADTLDNWNVAMASNWDTWITYFRDSVQNMMGSEDQIRNSPKECTTKCAIICPVSGNLLAADQGNIKYIALCFVLL